MLNCRTRVSHGFKSHSHRSGNISIGRLSTLGVGGCGFKSHFPDVSEKMLELVFMIPLFGGIALILTPRDNSGRLKKVALEWSLLTLTATILLGASFDGDGLFQVIRKIEWIPGLEPVFGPVVFAVDGISIFFLILTALLTPICILIS